MKTYKRRNYFIDKGAQARFIVGFVISSMLGGLTGVGCFVYFARQKIDSTLYSMRLPEVAIGDLLMKEMLLTMTITTALVLILFLITAAKVFRRIDGPLKKMAAVVRRIGNGDLQGTVKLRENDEFQDLAEELDAMVDNTRRRFSSIRKHATGAVKVSVKSSDMSEKRKQFEEHLDALKKEISAFRI